MTSYISNTPAQTKEMLDFLGIRSADELFVSVDESVRLKKQLDLPEEQNEFEVYENLKNLALKNKQYKSIFRGAGAYSHLIPSVVAHILSRGEFVTAYTPYQPEMSQGILQAIFEYQTMICNLTGLDVSNASVYDGDSACAEAAVMCKTKKSNEILISETVNPSVLQVVKTYAKVRNMPVKVIAQKEGITDIQELKNLVCDSTCAIICAQVNYFGNIEDLQKIAKVKSNAKLIAIVNPVIAGILKSAGESGADIATGEGQPLGIPLSFGGPYLGFMSCKQELMRSLPGRIVGRTADKNGNTAYVLTLQAREQHIRREKANSSICSNQALCALTAAVYLGALGSEGLSEVASLCYSNAHYLAKKLETLDFSRVYPCDFFHEFVTTCPVDTQKLLDKLEDNNILGPLVLDYAGGHGNPPLLLWCATEANTVLKIDELINLIS